MFPLDLLLLCHTAFLEFLTATTWTRVIPTNLGACLFWFRRVKKPGHFRNIVLPQFLFPVTLGFISVRFLSHKSGIPVL